MDGPLLLRVTPPCIWSISKYLAVELRFIPSIAAMFRIVNPSGFSNNIFRIAEISSGNFSTAIVVVHNIMGTIYFFLVLPSTNALHMITIINPPAILATISCYWIRSGTMFSKTCTGQLLGIPRSYWANLRWSWMLSLLPGQVTVSGRNKLEIDEVGNL